MMNSAKTTDLYKRLSQDAGQQDESNNNTNQYEGVEFRLIGKCGFYCGACPTFLAGNCTGCMDEHQEGDCFTRDCVIKRELNFCGECREFPCSMILTRPHTTVLDKDWLQWKKQSDTNR